MASEYTQRYKYSECYYQSSLEAHFHPLTGPGGAGRSKELLQRERCIGRLGGAVAEGGRGDRSPRPTPCNSLGLNPVREAERYRGVLNAAGNDLSGAEGRINSNAPSSQVRSGLYFLPLRESQRDQVSISPTLPQARRIREHSAPQPYGASSVPLESHRIAHSLHPGHACPDQHTGLVLFLAFSVRVRASIGRFLPTGLPMPR